uniref:FIST_C domain-containing protein n=1 Tax=Macrostomum lignano TaxID=282301 RepID=A0A1I8FEX4_9PLAT
MLSMAKSGSPAAPSCADWHLPYRLLVFRGCLNFSEPSSCPPTAGEMAEAEAGRRCQTEAGRRRQTHHPRHQSSSSTESAGRGSSHLQALKAFAAAELPPGARLHLAGSFAGAIGTPEGAAGVPVEMETGKSSDVRQMHGLAHVRLYTLSQAMIRADSALASGRRAAAAGSFAEAAAGLAKQKRQPPPEPTDEARSDAGIDHSRLVFYGDRLRVLSAMVTDAEDLERLSSLQPLLPGQCLAFNVHSAATKGSKHYLDQPDIETGVFSRLLAGVPVLGLFSEGEFSRNCSPGERFARCAQPATWLEGLPPPA